ncbi:MAG: Uncharacterized protein G01um101431_282 [Parcubacteria group bacterium Gr01-1014_31]|nr:MAG: Uncharacterized protein G01um101431_282 [Parcubacteria group bacterium Gr01-1014_31]
MDRYLAKITTLQVDPAHGGSAGKVFVGKPTLEKEIAAGKLFGFAELTGAQPEGTSLVDQLLDEAKDELYQTGAIRRAGGLTPAADLEERFGQVLQHVNGAVATFLETHRTGTDFQQSSILLGNIRQQQLVISTVGRVTGYLFHYRPTHDYQTVTITEPTPGVSVNPLRLFTQTIAGSLGPLDTAMFCSDGLLDYLSLHTLKTTVTGNAGPDAVRQLKTALLRARPKTPAVAIIISLVLHRPAPLPLSLKNFDYLGAASRDSMRTLAHTQRQTSRVLTPRLLPDVQKFWHWLQETGQRYRQRVHDRRPSRPAPNAPVLPVPPPTPPPRPSHSALRKVSAFTATTTRRAFTHPVVKTAGAMVATLAANIWRRYRSWSWKRQLAVAGSLVLAVLLVWNLATLSGRRAVTAREKAFATVLAQAERLRDAAQASLIYQDETGARERLNEGLRILDQLPETYAAHPTVVRTRRELNTKLNELRHEVVIADPLQLANFNNLDDDARAAPTMVRLGERLYAQNARSKVFFTLNLGNRSIAEIQPSTALEGTLNSATALSRTAAVLLDDDGRVLRLDGTDQIRPLPLTLPGGNAVAVASFRERLYLLSAVSGTIFRADPAGGGFGAPRNWIADPSVDLRTATDLTLDGDLYVLLRDGGIVKLNQGRPVTFDLQPIDPPLSGPTKIKTSEASAYLYLLDPPTKRIVVVGKDGKLARQYRSAAFDELRDIVVDEAAKTIYVLNGARLYGVPMEHL